MANERLDDEEGKGEGEGEGKGAGGGPRLKPDLALFDPVSAIDDGGESDKKGSGSSGSSDSGESKGFGNWELLQDGLLIYNREKRKRLLLEQLDTPGKMMKVIVALGSQEGWHTDDLIKTLDKAAQMRLGKGLYQLVSTVKDNATIDWVSGRVATVHQRDMDCF